MTGESTGESYERLRAQRDAIESKRLLSLEDVIAVIENLLTVRTQKQLANELGISASYLNDVLNARRIPGPSLTKQLGIERVQMYRRIRK